MTRTARARRRLLLVALVPQLLLGLGPGAAVCVAADGHVRVELVAGVCCDEGGPLATSGRPPATLSPDEPGCGPCSDFAVAPEPRMARGGGARGLDPDAAGPACAAEPTVELRPGAAGPARGRGIRSAHDHVPPHLARLRGVVQRC